MDALPSLAQWLDAFGQYNATVYPMPLVAYAAALVVTWLLLRHARRAGGVALGVLACFWLWTGIMFHVFVLAPFTDVGALFAVLFVAQGVMLLLWATRPDHAFDFHADAYGVTGLVLVAYAAAGVPLIGLAAGHTYPEAIAFGVEPCTTTLFTFGVLLMARTRVPTYLLAIPLLWCVAGSLPVGVGLVENAALLPAGVAAAVMIVRKNRTLHPVAAPVDVGAAQPAG